jgi:hypothetical protein
MNSTVGAITLAVLGTALSLGCAAGPKQYVTPGADGINRLRIRAEERLTAERTAIRGAKDFCADGKQQVVFIEQKVQYTGTMDEATRELIRATARAAGAAASQETLRKPGGSSTGRVLQSGGAAVGEIAGGDDYQADVVFQCR